jgi:hypothetical protein
MTTLVSREEQPLVRTSAVQPSLLITMPFEPKLNDVKVIEQQVRLILKRAERLLLAQYESREIRLVVQKMQMAFESLDFHSFKKSIAVFISGSSYQLLYVDITLKQQVLINVDFHVSDLLRLQEIPLEYLVVVLNDLWAKTYFGNEAGFKLIKTDRPKPFPDAKELGSFSIASRKKPVPGSLYKQISHDFSLIADAYHLPVFLVGSVRNVNHFGDITKSSKDIVQVIYKNTDSITESRIFHELKPYFNNWNYIRQKFLRHQLDDAAIKNLVASGMTTLIDKLNQGNDMLLMVEESYINGDHADSVHTINSHGEVVSFKSGIENDFDKIIQKLLENGAAVEVVPDGLLRDYDKIALIGRSSDQIFNHQVTLAETVCEIF